MSGDDHRADPVDCAKNVADSYHDAEQKAWDALARYKFWMFGYHAAQCVLLNRVGKLGLPNPFKPLVNVARIQIGGL